MKVFRYKDDIIVLDRVYNVRRSEKEELLIEFIFDDGQYSTDIEFEDEFARSTAFSQIEALLNSND
jgi:hypothetical protein